MAAWLFGNNPENQPLIQSVDFAGNFGFQPDKSVIQVEFKNLYAKKTFYKRQCRKNYKGQRARQVIDDGMVYGQAKYGGEQLWRIRGWVRREPGAAELYQDHNGDVLICDANNEELNLISENDMTQFTKDGHTLQSFSVDLGEIYDGPYQPVFELARANMEKMNKFQLIIQLVFLDGDMSEKFVSPVFMCCTKKRKTEEEIRNDDVAGKRNKRIDSESSVPSNTSSCESTCLDTSRRHKQILVEILDAKTANIQELVCDRMSTSKADVAYHLRLKNPLLKNELEEGSIVGFYRDKATNELRIEKLRSDNIYDALHAGVISRSYWIEGNKPLIPGETDTVCVIGIVPVKVIGAIEHGERIYASIDYPGMAIPQSQIAIGSVLRKKHVLLGMSIEGHKSNDGEEAGDSLVKCFVCIVLDVSRQELLEEIEDLYKVVEKQTESQVKQHAKKTWRKIKCCFAMAIIVVLAATFFMYQWLAPGSLFRYWLCRRGSIPNHRLYFQFQDVNNRTVPVRGIEFSSENLQNKVGVQFNDNHLKPNGKARYFLNIDRCAYYYVDGAVGNNIGGHKYIGGGRMLSTFDECEVVYECREGERDSWEMMKYQEKVYCDPPGK